MDELLHHVGPHDFLAHGAFLYVSSLGKHSQQCLHFEHAQYGCVCLSNAIGIEEIFLNLTGDHPVTEWIFFQCLNRGQEHGYVFKGIAAALHAGKIAEADAVLRHNYIQRGEFAQHRRSRQ